MNDRIVHPSYHSSPFLSSLSPPSILPAPSFRVSTVSVDSSVPPDLLARCDIHTCGARTMPPILMEGSWIAHPPMLPSSGADLFIHPLLSPTFLIPAISRAFLLQRVSDGGNELLVASDAEDHRLTEQILPIPTLMITHPAAYPEKSASKRELLSIEQNKDDPIVPKACIEFFLVPPSHVEFLPILLTHEDLRAAHIQAAGLDPLQYAGLLYERILREVGGTRLDIYPGVPHAIHASFPRLVASRRWETDFRA
ncbi:hypothetical protein B0H11DRAFT_2183148 [Mycena galericulata]|nr:hypothetical protein B0H11DRAFT_2183148 [Mycena galericulata]